MTSSSETPGGPGAVSDERLRAAERFVEEEEGAVSRFGGALETLVTALLVIMSLFHLYAAVSIVPTLTLRPVHVGFMLLLVFLIYPATPRFRNRLMWYDVVLALVGVATIVHILMGGDDFWDRSTLPDRADLVAVHREAKNITLEAQANGSPIAFHPGALKYFKEQGVKFKQ